MAGPRRALRGDHHHHGWHVAGKGGAAGPGPCGPPRVRRCGAREEGRQQGGDNGGIIKRIACWCAPNHTRVCVRMRMRAHTHVLSLSLSCTRMHTLRGYGPPRGAALARVAGIGGIIMGQLSIARWGGDGARGHAGATGPSPCRGYDVPRRAVTLSTARVHGGAHTPAPRFVRVCARASEHSR